MSVDACKGKYGDCCKQCYHPKREWTRVVNCTMSIPIRIDPDAADAQAIEQVKKLFIDRLPSVAGVMERMQYTVESSYE